MPVGGGGHYAKVQQRVYLGTEWISLDVVYSSYLQIRQRVFTTVNFESFTLHFVHHLLLCIALLSIDNLTHEPRLSCSTSYNQDIVIQLIRMKPVLFARFHIPPPHY